MLAINPVVCHFQQESASNEPSVLINVIGHTRTGTVHPISSPIVPTRNGSRLFGVLHNRLGYPLICSVGYSLRAHAGAEGCVSRAWVFHLPCPLSSSTLPWRDGEKGREGEAEREIERAAPTRRTGCSVKERTHSFANNTECQCSRPTGGRRRSGAEICLRPVVREAGG